MQSFLSAIPQMIEDFPADPFPGENRVLTDNLCSNHGEEKR
jgi:hypothetical protein